MRLTRFSLSCPSGLSSGRLWPSAASRSEASQGCLPTCDPTRALAAALSASLSRSLPRPYGEGQWEEKREKGGGAGAERVEGGDWSPGRRREPEGGRRQRAQGAAGGSQLSARPAAASACRGAAGRDGLVRGRPLLLPRFTAPPALWAPPTGEWPRLAGRERGRASALCVTALGPSQGRAPGGAEPLRVREPWARREPEARLGPLPVPSPVGLGGS